MKHNWLKLTESCSIPLDVATRVWGEIERRHGEAHRAYHNLSHLAALFAVLDEMVGEGTVPTAVSLAVWFHDSVYDPTSGSNEADSAELMVSLLAGWVDGALLAEAKRLILLTKSHQTEVGDKHGRFLLDADLSILGTSPTRYAHYADQIRQEYSHVPDDLYRPGRTAVLQKFLAQSPLYLTEYGRIQWEAQAKKNLAWEIEMLKEGN